jgi:hypothetical protein
MLQFQVVFSKGLYTWNLVDDDFKVVAESKLFVKDKATIYYSIDAAKDGIFHARIIDNTPGKPPDKRHIWTPETGPRGTYVDRFQ